MHNRTKAETIEYIYNRLSCAKVKRFYYFTHSEWIEKKSLMWEQIQKHCKLSSEERLIVRSSCFDEDKDDISNAGKYLSVPNVRTEDEFQNAVERVIRSYTSEGRTLDEKDQILVQPMLEEVKICGVAFTMDPNNGGNYDVINYDTSGDTDGITSGSVVGDRLFYHYKEAEGLGSQQEYEPFLTKLFFTLRELETIFKKYNLDVEFAIDSSDDLYILQVRELHMKTDINNVSEQTKTLGAIYKKIMSEPQKKPFLCGDRAIYSVMTDWNPAEMIGIYPKSLALSLYREIITDSVWAYQRDNYGYRNLRSFPLLVEFGGVPYIDVRVSFNSFVPAGLEDRISDKLVNYYLNRLAEHPEEHDKAEFNIVFSCYTFDLPERIGVLKKHGFSDEEIGSITDSLRGVTNQIIDHKTGLWRKDYAKIEKLKTRYDEILSSNMSDIEKIYWLLEDCKRYGTLPFAGLARGAFVAVQLLRSMVSVGILTQNDYDEFMGGIDSVSSQMNRDFRVLRKDAFLKKYGHLRPGTYDITSPRYDERPEMYFDWKHETDEREDGRNQEFRLSMEQMHMLRDYVLKSGLNNDILELLDFIKRVIEGREYGKFIFTRNLSKALQLIGEIGKNIGLTTDDMAYMDIHAIYDIYSSSRDMETVIKASIEKGKRDQATKIPLRLPPVITNPTDILSFYYPDSEPNFITLGRASGEVVDIRNVMGKEIFGDKILMIPSADPGYDWIFSRGIAGFITMYGGANSHMAIRSGELGIPAVIGTGERLFEKYSSAKALEINAESKQVTILR